MSKPKRNVTRDSSASVCNDLLGPVPDKFFRAVEHPIAYTVGELIPLLNELPKEMPVESGIGDGVIIVVYNHGMADEHVEFDEIDPYGT